MEQQSEKQLKKEPSVDDLEREEDDENALQMPSK